MSGAHARLAPSAAEMWGPGGCPAYPTMAALYPEPEDGEEAREGTAAHWWVSEAIGGTVHAEGAIAPNAYPVTAEMLKCGATMVGNCLAVAMEADSFNVETRVYMPTVHEDNWGTPDFFAINVRARKIWVKDYKFGHRYVEVYKNWQLLDYLAGVCNHYGVILDASWTIHFTIYQPRCFSRVGAWENEWTCNGAEALALIAQLAVAAVSASGVRPPCHTGPYCRDCTAKIGCAAFQRATENAIDVSLQAAPNELTPEQKGLVLSYVQAAQQRLQGMATGLEASLKADIRAGKRIAGWEITNGETEKWTKPEAEVVALGKMMGVELTKPKLLTPNQAREAGLDPALVGSYAAKVKGEAKLSPVDEASAMKAFG